MNEQDQKDAMTLTQYSDRKDEYAFPINNPNNDLRTLDPKQTLEDLDEANQIIENYKDDLDDDAIEKMITWMKQRRQDWQDWRAQQKEDEVSQALKNVVSHDTGGQYQPDDPCDDPEYSKNQGQE
jgi:hypothetical protein